jgi:HEAT repeat protein
VPALIEVLEGSRDPYLVADAVEALGKIGDALAQAALARLLRTAPVLVRLRVVEALGRIGGVTAESTLREALNDPSDAVRARAREALQALERDGGNPGKRWD